MQNGFFKWGLLLTVGYLLIRSTASKVLSSLAVQNVEVRTGAITVSGLPLSIFITIENKSDITVVADKFIGKLMYGQYAIADVSFVDQITIPSSQSVAVEITSFINFSNLAGNILAIVNSGNFLNDLRLIGTLSYGRINIPIDMNVI